MVQRSSSPPKRVSSLCALLLLFVTRHAYTLAFSPPIIPSVYSRRMQQQQQQFTPTRTSISRTPSSSISSSTAIYSTPPPRQPRRMLKKRRRNPQRQKAGGAAGSGHNGGTPAQQFPWDSTESRPLIKSMSREAGEDYWIDEGELAQFEQQQQAIKNRKAMEGEVSKEKLWKEVKAPYQQNWIGYFSVGIAILSAIIIKFPELLDQPAIPIPDL